MCRTLMLIPTSSCRWSLSCHAESCCIGFTTLGVPGPDILRRFAHSACSSWARCSRSLYVPANKCERGDVNLSWSATALLPRAFCLYALAATSHRFSANQKVATVHGCSLCTLGTIKGGFLCAALLSHLRFLPRAGAGAC